MPVVWNPTERPIMNVCCGIKTYLKPGEKKRIEATTTMTGEVLDPNFIARKYMNDNRQVGLIMLTDEQAAKITDLKVDELREEAREKLIEFCQKNIAAINDLNAEQVANSRAPVRIPSSLKELQLCLVQMTGVDHPDEIGAGFLSTKRLKEMRKDPTVAAHMDAVTTAIEKASTEEGEKTLESGLTKARKQAKVFGGAPSETEFDEAHRQPSNQASGKARAASKR